jgi:integrase/recombinase XerD
MTHTNTTPEKLWISDGAQDVLAFVAAQREPRRGATVVRIEDGKRGLAARTIKRRLATLSGLYEYLLVRGDTPVTRNPVPRGLALRRDRGRAVRGVPLIRAPRTRPRILDPDEANAFLAALRTHRDRAMVEAMLLGGLRRFDELAEFNPNRRRNSPTSASSSSTRAVNRSIVLACNATSSASSS